MINTNTHIISEYRHWEETHCCLLEGGDRCLLIDTGLDDKQQVMDLLVTTMESISDKMNITWKI